MQWVREKLGLLSSASPETRVRALTKQEFLDPSTLEGTLFSTILPELLPIIVSYWKFCKFLNPFRKALFSFIFLVLPTLKPLSTYVSKSTFGRRGDGEGCLLNPRGAVIEPSTGHIFVSCAHSVQVFTKSGEFVRRVGTKGNVKQVQGVDGMAFDLKGNLVVGANNHVLIIDPSDNLVLKFGGLGSLDGQFDQPYAICLDVDGNLIVADYGNHRLQWFTPKGEFIKKYGTGFQGDELGQLGSPTGVTVDAENNVIVADRDNQRIQIFNPKMEVIRAFGKLGSDPGQFTNPWGVCADSTGKIVVCDVANSRIQFFSHQGEFLLELGGYGDENGKVKNAWRAVIDTNGDLVVVEYGDPGRIQIFG